MTNESQVHTPETALAYLIDCTLATVAHQATLKRKSKSEFNRQISIAQKGISWAVEMGVDLSTTRANAILNKYGGSVRSWAEQI